MIKMDLRVLCLFILIVCCHLLFNQSLQLHYDEAYYWVWSKNLQLSYYDHPPLIAYLIRVTTLFSDREFFIRLTAVLCSTITVIMIYKTTQWLFTQAAANLAVVLALAWPILEGNFFITTIDCPLLMTWSITVYCLARGLLGDSKPYLYAAGFSLGLGLLAKYIAILLALGVFLFLLISPRKRKLLLSYPVYLAFLLALLVFSPVIWWNYQHDWVSFTFQLAHGIPATRQFNWASLGDFIGATLGAANPFISLPLLIFMLRKRRQIMADDRFLLLCMIFLSVVLFFGYNSCYKFMEANWVAPAFISGIIALAAWLSESGRQWVAKVAISLILILLPIVKMPEVFVPRAYQSKIPAINAFKGNWQLYARIQDNYLEPGDIILACDYGNASRGWYYLHERTYVLPDFRYSNSYANWNARLPRPIRHALYYCDNDEASNIALLKPYFKQIESLGAVSYHDSFVNNKLYVYRLSN